MTGVMPGLVTWDFLAMLDSSEMDTKLSFSCPQRGNIGNLTWQVVSGGGHCLALKGGVITGQS